MIQREDARSQKFFYIPFVPGHEREKSDLFGRKAFLIVIDGVDLKA
jgi:hypothetical protein